MMDHRYKRIVVICLALHAGLGCGRTMSAGSSRAESNRALPIVAEGRIVGLGGCVVDPTISTLESDSSVEDAALRLVELAEEALRARSFEEFAEGVLPVVAGIKQSRSALLYVSDSRLAVPRFFQQPFERRVLTLIHELYHIAPAFDGTIRRFGTRSHGGSRAKFNDNLQPLVDGYLAANPSEELLAILRSDLKVLARDATLFGRHLGLPKPVRLWRE